MKTEEEEDEYLKKSHWNRKEKESKWLLYLLIGILCFSLAWMISGGLK